VPEKPTDVVALIAALEREEVDYVLVGGVAMTLHGSSFVTVDADIAFLRSRKKH
jgi:hypothetical protein